MKMCSEVEHQQMFTGILRELNETGQLEKEKLYMQHGSTTVYEHSLHVAMLSVRMAERMHFAVHYESLIRGALLHDYFLYDWHEKDASHRLHGFFHPGKSLHNATRDYKLNHIEKNIILRHMFPLTPIPPYYMEAWIVCAADKCCATAETLERFGVKPI